MSEKRPTDKRKRQDARALEIEENLCVWMKARVVNFKLCDRTYDCLTCPFDRAMKQAWAQDSRKEDA